ncbi:MAG: ACP S-malonyltransferase [Candidatus Marinimicrobia bacterium]|nr:ACP S-malonyltransferase [Candidatus Neomarinimicrobiota bacterium]MBL6826755.1 ACP S-malonyltransferase [Candidatus Neomarinimicrobiota bacterium]MDA0753593.1 ACP S-malonyltransferase [Candidatus Neomarinimicrobiota bacterium]MDA1363470.1 ACP S-malonyltransferase [Candidatus Neomarinimicrobiota bacterium]
MKNCFIFSGQGSHRPGMSLNLYNKFQLAKDRIELSNKILGYNISEIMFSAEENVLRQTQYAQPAIFIHSTIIFDLIKDQKECVAVAGHSLGEFSALYANNFFDFETGLQIVDVRAKAMHECELNNPGKMSAVIGASIDKIQTICDSFYCQIANINSDSQIVISGSEESIDLASESLKTIGAKVIPLSVSGAFHSKLMSEAKNKLTDIINISRFNEVSCPIVSNFNARPNRSIEEIKHALIEQIDNPVQWSKSIQLLGELSNNFVEIGPKKVLSNIIKKIDDSLIITTYNSIENL